MRITYAHLCDYALKSSDGKLSVLGIFQGLHVTKEFPAIHPVAYLAFELEFASAEIGTPVEVVMRVRDADGGDIAEFSFKVESSGPAPPGQNPTFTHFIPMHQMKFDAPGTYEFAFFLGGRYDHSAYLVVNDATNQG